MSYVNIGWELEFDYQTAIKHFKKIASTKSEKFNGSNPRLWYIVTTEINQIISQ